MSELQYELQAEPLSLEAERLDRKGRKITPSHSTKRGSKTGSSGHGPVAKLQSERKRVSLETPRDGGH